MLYFLPGLDGFLGPVLIFCYQYITLYTIYTIYTEFCSLPMLYRLTINFIVLNDISAQKQ